MAATPAEDTVVVTGEHGVRGRMRRPGTAPSSEVVLADGRHVWVPTHLLRPQSDGTYHLPIGLEQLTTGPAPQAIPLVAEQLQVQKRQVETGRVRVTKSVETREEVVDVPLVREEVTVERVPVERFVTEPPAVRHEGDVTVIPVVEEVLVVERRMMVREEIRLTRRRVESHETQAVTLRREVAHVERVPAPSAPPANSP